MMNIKKLTVTCAMAAVLATAAAPTATVSAATVSCSQTKANKCFTKGKLCYQVSGKNTCTVTGLSKSGKNAASCTIPATVTCNGKTYKVTKVAAKAFQNCNKLKSVKVCSNQTAAGTNCWGNANVQYGSSCKK